MIRHACSLVAALLLAATADAAAAGPPYQATGIKIGEVGPTTAIVWTRLTRIPERVGGAGGRPVIRYLDTRTGERHEDGGGRRRTWTPEVTFPAGGSADSLEGAVPGTAGEVRILYRRAGSADWEQTAWQPVDPSKDHTCQIKLDGLEPGTPYELRSESRAGGETGQSLAGTFRTAPAKDEARRVVFTVTTGQRYGEQESLEGFKMYPQMLKLDPDFFVHTGDILYYDQEGKTLPLARWHWQRIYSLPTNVEFHRKVASYFIKDDHDTWMNDCWPGMETLYMGDFTFAEGQAVFLEQVPMGERTWRSYRWGSDLQVWLVEGRDHRSPNTMEDGPGKTIWGAEQMAWFKRSFAESDATFRVLISPTPIVGPDRGNKNDNHANAGFQYEGDALRTFLGSQQNAFVVCGDRHWQYVSSDPETGVREFSCGPVTDQHAGGFSEDQRSDMHAYLNIVGGFLSCEVDRRDGVPTLTFRHHGVDGQLYNEVEIR